MATLIEEVLVNAPASQVWSAVAAFGDIDTRLMPGYVAQSQLDGSVRTLTMADGMVLREQLIDCDHGRRRLAYTVENEHLSHHNASLQVFETPEGGARLVWTVDVLPDALAPLLAPGHAHALTVAADFLSREAAANA